MTRICSALKLTVLSIAFWPTAVGWKLQSLDKPRSYVQTLHNFKDTQYFADFTIGGQQIAGIFDTGSSDVIVRSSRCKECVHPTPPYRHEDSWTYRENGTLGLRRYGSGECVTMLGYDTVQVGDLSAENQAIYEITEHTMHALDAAKFAAIVGIGPGFSFNSSEKTLLMNYNIEEFSVCLQKPAGSDGLLRWGPSEHPLRLDQTVNVNVTGQHHWSTTLRDVKFTGGSKNRTKNPLSIFGSSSFADPCSDETGCTAVIDSGTSLIAAPSEQLWQLSNDIGVIEEDCSNLHELPTLKFVLDGEVLELPPQAYVMRVKGASLEAGNIWDLLWFKPKIRKLDMCMAAFIETSVFPGKGGPTWIFGMPFFRYFHTTFDRASKTMRFAKAGENCEPEPLRGSTPSQDEEKPRFSSLSTDSAAWQPLDVDLSTLVLPRMLTKSSGNLQEDSLQL
eukprot:gb/GFBE01069882.1/.p1 GENE.gb/GFBE01069882.1/~~gb/GFBE01069882.1/.p1  ORF type:complete len:448 (+),score=92.97 gb/GFBE01069882.1/:1-1344(+)